MAQTVTPSQLSAQLEINVQHGIPSMVWGPPGVGKSEIVQSVAKELGRNHIDLRMNLLDPVDMRGIPSIESDECGLKRTVWSVPDFLPVPAIHGSYGVLMLEELTTAPQSVQATGYQLVRDRAVGNYKLPNGWAIIALGNSLSDQAATYDMPAPLKNRFAHFWLEPDHGDLIKYAQTHAWNEMIIAYLRFKPENMFKFDPENTAYATPRSWEMASDRLKIGNLNPETMFIVLSGIIGEAVAADFVGFMKLVDQLPDMTLIETMPSKAPVPSDIGSRFALIGALAQNTTPVNFQAFIDYTQRMDDNLHIAYMRDVTLANEMLMASPIFTKWCADPKNQALFTE
jgi:MoxR-like ATPase